MLATLDTLELVLTAYSGFNYPQNLQVVSLLGAAAGTTGNAILQQSALTLRQATLSWVAADDSDVEAARALYESRAEVVFTDEGETDHTVRVLEFSAAAHAGGGIWDCSATLIESPAGS